MRSFLNVVLLVTLLFAGGYFYNFAQAVCPIPISYRIGELDERFDLTLDEAKVAVAEAAEVWESATAQNLFSYDDEAKFVVNFVYDDRQASVEAQENFTEQLEAAENINDDLLQNRETKIARYNTLTNKYENLIANYESRHREYNQTVDGYNANGGAPPEVVEELNDEKKALEKMLSEINTLEISLDSLVAEINALGEKGENLIDNYNENVVKFNERFGHQREFTQGDFGGERIQIYTYKDMQELKTVLTHEFGHALSLDHVEDEESVMYYLMGKQPESLRLSTNDMAEFNRVCGDMSIWDKIVYRLSTN